jgi:hypothetical protein
MEAQDALVADLFERLAATGQPNEVVDLVLAAMRGFLMEWQTTRSTELIDPALTALVRALEREEAAPQTPRR